MLMPIREEIWWMTLLLTEFHGTRVDEFGRCRSMNLGDAVDEPGYGDLIELKSARIRWHFWNSFSIYWPLPWRCIHWYSQRAIRTKRHRSLQAAFLIESIQSASWKRLTENDRNSRRYTSPSPGPIPISDMLGPRGKYAVHDLFDMAAAAFPVLFVTSGASLFIRDTWCWRDTVR